MPMKLLLIFIMFVSFNANTEEECIFNESAYVEFINKFTSENKNSKIENDSRTLKVERNNEQIVVKGGGCVHLGVSVDLKTKQAYTEEQFLHKILILSKEFGGWLINVNSLENSIKSGKFQIIDGVYFIEVDAMTVFSASFNSKGEVNVEFYIN
jgi:hypothetical protein